MPLALYGTETRKFQKEDKKCLKSSEIRNWRKMQMIFYIHGSVHRESNLITVQQDTIYSVYYISVGSSNSTTRADSSKSGYSIPEAVITVLRAPDDGCQHPKYVELPAKI